MAYPGVISPTKRVVSKLPSEPTLKDMFMPPRKTRPLEDTPGFREDRAASNIRGPPGNALRTRANSNNNIGNNGDENDASRKPASHFPMERCLRAPRPAGKGALFLGQKESEIRDGILHLKPVFHMKPDVLFVEFPTTEDAKQALEELKHFKVTGVSGTREMENILRTSLDLSEAADKNAELIRDFYANGKGKGVRRVAGGGVAGGGGAGGGGGGSGDVRENSKATLQQPGSYSSAQPGSYSSKLADRQRPTGTAAAIATSASYFTPAETDAALDGGDPFGLESIGGNSRNGSRSSGEEGSVKPRSESALGLKPVSSDGRQCASSSGNQGFVPRSVNQSVFQRDKNAGHRPPQGNIQPPPSLLGPGPGSPKDPVHEDSVKGVFDRISRSFSQLAEERFQLEKRKERFEFEMMAAKKEMDFERMKLVKEWRKVGAEREKFMESIEALRKALLDDKNGLKVQASNPNRPEKNNTDGQITCQDVRLMDKTNLNVWTEVCRKSPEPLIDLFSEDLNKADEDAKSVLVPASTAKRGDDENLEFAEDETAASPEVVEDQLDAQDGGDALEEFADLFLGAEETVIGTNAVDAPLEDAFMMPVHSKDILETTVGPKDDAVFFDMSPNGSKDTDVNNNVFIAETFVKHNVSNEEKKYDDDCSY